MKKIFVGIGIFLVFYAILRFIVTTNFDSGLAVILGAGIFLINAGWKKAWFYNTILLHKSFFIFFTGLFLIYAMVMETLILTAANSNEVPSKFNYLVVLGGGIKDYEPGEVLKDRLDKAIDYYHKHPKGIIIVSGGVEWGKNLSEAAVMKRYLVQNGVKKEQVLEEKRATSTKENLLFSARLVKKGEPLIIVTSDFHLFRAEWIAKRHHIPVIGMGVKTPLSAILQCHIREMLAIMKSVLLD